MAAPPGPVSVLRGHQGDVQCLEYLSPNLLAAGCVFTGSGHHARSCQGPSGHMSLLHQVPCILESCCQELRSMLVI